MHEIHVVKLGGSLLDLSDLTARFNAWRRAELGPYGVLIVGGGAAADTVRDVDSKFHLEPEAAHWLAIRAMQFNAHVLAAVLEETDIVRDQADCRQAWEAERLALVDPLVWLEREEEENVTIPHRWNFTSDSIAAHVARRLLAGRLTLLKSTLTAATATGELEKPGEDRVQRASRLGVVDADFPIACDGVPSVRLVNLRAPGPGGFASDVLR